MSSIRDFQRKKKYEYVAKIIKENQGKWFTNKKAIQLLTKQRCVQQSFSVIKMDRWLKTFNLKSRKTSQGIEYYFKENKKVNEKYKKEI